MWAGWSGSEAGSQIQWLPCQIGKEAWAEMGGSGPGREHNLPRGVCYDKPGRINKASALVTISSMVPSHYISEVLVTATQLSENAPATTAVPKPEEAPTLVPFNSPAHLSETPPPIIPLLLDLPFMGTPPVWCPFADFLAISTQKSRTTLLVVHLTIIATRGPASTPKRSKLGVITASTCGEKTC